MESPIVQILLLVGISQGFLLGFIILFSKFFQSKANQYFSYTILIVALISFINLLFQLNIESKWLMLINDIMLEYLFPVTFLFYFIFSLSHPLTQSKSRYLLFIPFILAAIINIIIDLEVEFHILSIGAVENESIVEAYYFWEYIGTIFFTILMSLWALIMIKRYQPESSLLYKKQWLFQFWSFANVLILFWLVDLITDIVANLDLLNYIYTGICLLFFWLSYRGIYQFKLAEEKYEIRSILERQENEIKAEPVASKVQQGNLYIHRLKKLMDKEHLYRDPDLNRDKVAAQLGISSGYFSQVFSQFFKQNFSEYINELRVADVKKMLADKTFQPYSIISIGFEAGFSSKSSFYAVFKKSTGMTPATYKKRQQQQKNFTND